MGVIQTMPKATITIEQSQEQKKEAFLNVAKKMLNKDDIRPQSIMLEPALIEMMGKYGIDYDELQKVVK